MNYYQVSYEGQIITSPLSLEEAAAIAVEENLDAFRHDSIPACEVVLSRIERPLTLKYRQIWENLLGHPSVFQKGIALIITGLFIPIIFQLMSYVIAAIAILMGLVACAAGVCRFWQRPRRKPTR